MREWILENTDITTQEYDNLINPNTINIEKISNHQIKESNKMFEHPMIAIDLFTQKKPNSLRKIKYRVVSEKKFYVHNKIKFIILADILNDMQEILYSTKRIGKCFKLSSEISVKYLDTSIVTAMCINPFFKEPTPFLHSIILSKDNKGKEYILDATFNIAIEKETYLKLFQANIISIIPREEYYNIVQIISQENLGDYINLEEYFCFPEKITTAVKKIVKSKLTKKIE